MAWLRRQPALVIQPSSAADVAAAVRFAAQHRLLLGVKGGGHNIAGTAIAQHGMVLDMAQLRDVAVDADAKDRNSRRWMPPARRRCGHSSAWLGDRARLRLRGRRCGTHARWRPRLPHAPIRLDGRQSRSRRDRHRGRLHPQCQSHRERGSLLGGARRRRQFRRRHALHVPPSRSRSQCVRRPDRVAVRTRRGSPRRLPNDHEHVTARAFDRGSS